MTSAPDRRPRPWRQQTPQQADDLPPDTPLDDVLLAIGRIVAAHGVRGEVKLDIYTDRPEEIAKLRRVYLNDDPTPRRVLRAGGTERQAILKLAGVDTRNDAEELRGTIVRIRGNQLAPREDDSYYHYQLIGLHVFLEDGSPIGTLTEIIETGEVDVYVVRDADGSEQLFPALKDVVLVIDPANDRVVVRPPEYVDVRP